MSVAQAAPWVSFICQGWEDACPRAERHTLPPLPLAPGVSRYPPYPCQLSWRYGSPGASAQRQQQLNPSDTEPVSEPVRGMAAAAAPVAVPASPGSPAGSAAATADSKPEAEADWLASMGKRFPPAEKK